ncbi:MAG: SIR2 family protein [Sphingomonadales bacterium]|nr:SIR2 family protein [Sphingomonadales bacterium]
MTDTVVLLGAGASADAGIPLSRALTETIWNRIDATDQHRDLKVIFGYVLGALIFKKSKAGSSPFEQIDIEEVLDAIEQLISLDRQVLSAFVHSWDPAILRLHGDYDPHKFQEGLAQAISAGVRRGLGERLSSFEITSGLQQAANAIRSSPLSSNPESMNWRVYQPIFGYLESSLEFLDEDVDYLRPLIVKGSEDAWVIATLNFDLTLEIACRRASIPYSNGLENWNKRKTVSWPRSFKGQRILKLHGSLDWRGSSEEIEFALSNGKESGLPPPLIRFGGGNKLTARGPFLPILSVFERSLKRAKNLIVVGYSFRDEHVNALLYRWAQGRKKAMVRIIDPEAKHHKFEEFVRALFQNFTQLTIRTQQPPLREGYEIIAKRAKEGIAEVFQN